MMGKDDMDRGLPKRRSPAHPAPTELDGHPIVVFLTVCTKNRRSLLATEQVTNLLIYWWRQADAWLVGRYVVMPDHIHLFCSPRDLDAHPLTHWVHFWKAGVTRDWPIEKDKPIWQRDFWDRQIRTGERYDQKWEYVQTNPCRHGFVERPEDWPFQGELNVLEWSG
jgi:putative transposase